jgi:hypothetical protein
MIQNKLIEGEDFIIRLKVNVLPKTPSASTKTHKDTDNISVNTDNASVKH